MKPTCFIIRTSLKKELIDRVRDRIIQENAQSFIQAAEDKNVDLESFLRFGEQDYDEEDPVQKIYSYHSKWKKFAIRQQQAYWAGSITMVFNILNLLNIPAIEFVNVLPEKDAL